MRHVFVICLLIICGRFTVDSARILGIFIHPAISHFRAFRPVLRALGEKGHDVYVVTHFPEKDPPTNYHEFILKQDDILTGTAAVDEVSKFYYFIIFLCHCVVFTFSQQCTDFFLSNLQLSNLKSVSAKMNY